MFSIGHSISPNQNILITPTTAVQRGAANVLANWQTVVLRLAESIATGAIVLALVFTMVMPFMLTNSSNLKEVVSDHLWAAFGVAVLVLMLIVFFILLSAFVAAGNARTLIDGELAASTETALLTPPIGGYRAFDLKRWLQAARSFMWPVAGIYVTVAVLTFLLLLVLFGLFAVLGAVAGPLACCGAVILFPLAIVGAVFSAVLTAKAIIICVHRSATTSASLGEAWNLIMGEFGVHFWTACIIGVTTLVIAIVVGGVSGLLNLAAPSKSAPFAMALAPLQIVIFVVQQAFGAAVSSWFAASMTALAEIRRTPGAPTASAS